MNTQYKLSPSFFAYLWEECRHCYYQKVKNGVAYYGPFPSMFGRINALLQDSVMGQNLKDIHPGLPSGIIESQEGQIKSILIPGTNCFISGKYDLLAKLDDGTYAVIDFKITSPDAEKVQKYASQLKSYKYALENPANGANPITVSSIGVVTINPEAMKLTDGKVVFTTTPTWHTVDNEMDSFHALIQEISGVLNGELPAPTENCALCKYRVNFETISTTSAVEDIPF